MEITIKNPTQAYLSGFDQFKNNLQKSLTYVDQRIDFELTKSKKTLKKFTSSYLKNKLISSWGTDKFDSVIEDLKTKIASLTDQRKKSLLFDNAEGTWIYSGLAYGIAVAYGCPIRVAYDLPEPELLPWANKPKFAARDYQLAAHDALLEKAKFGPCGIELATGAGKSKILLDLVKTLSLPTLIAAPSVSIASQLYADFEHAFGKRYVGMVGNGKKEYKKRIVIAIDASLAKIEPGSEAWNLLSAKQVLCFDEAHLAAATTLSKVCFGLMAYAPYRFFVSATQLRNDGSDLLLEGITGPIVYRKDAKELIDEGYLSKPIFKMVTLRSKSQLDSDDSNKMTREHLYYNPAVCQTAGELANHFVDQKKPVLILVEELEQFRDLLPFFKHKAAFAHGPLTKDTKLLVPNEYQDSKPTDLVAAFNRGEIPILVGTSCISTGTDVRVAEAAIYIQGGKSEIKVKQAIGRSTRGGVNSFVQNPWTGVQKTECIWVDFDVVRPGDERLATHRHAEARRELYANVYAAPIEINREKL